MIIKKIILSLTIVSYVCIGYSQSNELNQYNSNGEKIGLWIENDGHTEVYYRDGLRHGLFKVYSRKNGKLASFGEFENGEKSGTWYLFDESSLLYAEESQIKTNSNFKRIRDDEVEIVPKYTSWLKIYYSNGRIKEEGRIIYDGDMEIDHYKTGIWKYFNTKGELIKTENESN